MPRRTTKAQTDTCDNTRKLTRTGAYKLKDNAKSRGTTLRVYPCRYDCYLKGGSRAWHVRRIRRKR